MRRRITDPSDPAARFERDGFRFVLLDDTGTQISAEFETDLTGRPVCPDKLEIGRAYTLRETFSPLPGVPTAPDVQVVLDKPNKTVPVTNAATSTTPYALA